MTTQPSLLDWQPPPQIFGPRHGVTFEPKRDTSRLNAQAMRVFKAMESGEWLSLLEIQARILSSTGKYDPEASISARIRDLRSPKLGGFDVPHRYVRRGLFEYRLIA